MKKTGTAVVLGILCLGFSAGEASPESFDEALKRVAAAVAEAQRTRTRFEFTGNKIPVEVGDCSSPRYYEDPLGRRRVAMGFGVTYCKEKVTFEEREDGTEGRGIFKRVKWVRIPGTERTSYEYAQEREDFDVSYDPDSFRTPEAILRDLEGTCRGRRDELSRRMLNERASVRCR